MIIGGQNEFSSLLCSSIDHWLDLKSSPNHVVSSGLFQLGLPNTDQYIHLYREFQLDNGFLVSTFSFLLEVF